MGMCVDYLVHLTVGSISNDFNQLKDAKVQGFFWRGRILANIFMLLKLLLLLYDEKEKQK